MLRVPIADARPGMILAIPVYHPRRHDTALLKAGMPLDARTIARLSELRIRELWVRYPGMEFIEQFVSPDILESHAAVTHHLSSALDALTQDAHARLDFAEYRSAIASLLRKLLTSGRAAIFVQELAETDERGLRHGSSVCLMSLLMGLKLDDYLVVERSRLHALVARDVSALGLGALLHDVGMLRLDPKTVDRWRAEQRDEDPEFQRHVHIGHELVKDAIGPAAAAGVLHHHQKFDGTGFPQRTRLDGSEEPVTGSDIHIFARIIGAADLFDRLRHAPSAAPGAAPTPVVRVLSRLQQQPHAAWLDPMVFKALLAVVPAYAPGSIVRLSDGRYAAVIDWFPDDPCRPMVQTVSGPEAGFVPGDDTERIALRRRADLSITESEGQDVSRDNFYPETPGQFDLKLAGRALFNRAAVPAS